MTLVSSKLAKYGHKTESAPGLLSVDPYLPIELVGWNEGRN